MTNRDLEKLINSISEGKIELLTEIPNEEGNLIYITTKSIKTGGSTCMERDLVLFKVQDQIAGGIYLMGDSEFHMITLKEFRGLGYMSRYLHKMIKWQKKVEKKSRGLYSNYVQGCSVEIYNKAAIAVLHKTIEEIELQIKYRHTFHGEN